MLVVASVTVACECAFEEFLQLAALVQIVVAFNMPIDDMVNENLCCSNVDQAPFLLELKHFMASGFLSVLVDDIVHIFRFRRIIDNTIIELSTQRCPCRAEHASCLMAIIHSSCLLFEFVITLLYIIIAVMDSIQQVG